MDNGPHDFWAQRKGWEWALEEILVSKENYFKKFY